MIENTHEAFELWFHEQEFYHVMRFMYGDSLFIKECGVYHRLHVQIAWVVWQKMCDDLDRVANQLSEVFHG